MFDITKREVVRFLGARHSDAASSAPAHEHEFYELNFMTRGRTRMRLNEKIIEYDSYDFLLIPPHISHILYESEYDLFDNYVIWFELDDSEILLENQIIKLHDYDGAVQFLCAEIYKNYIKSRMEEKELLNIYLDAVLWHMKRGLILETDPSVQSSADMVDEAIKFININIKNARISVEMLARKLNISEEHFSRMFKKKIGIPPVRYINEVKIAEAQRMLINTNLSVKEIAGKLYYSDPYYFSQQFKKITGYSPSSYRESSLH